MSKKANPAAVGAFTLGAILVLVGILLVFGAGKLTKQTVDCVVYFDGSIEGLDVGAPVIYRGVKVGAVKQIKLIYDGQDDEFRIPVVIEMFKNSAVPVNSEPIVHADRIDELVAKGARAQLTAQSLLTGKLNISLDFYPDKPARLAPDTTGLPQIPSIPMTLKAMSEKLESLPLEEIVYDIRSTMQGITKLVNAPETHDVITQLNATLVSADRLVNSIQSNLDQLSDDPEAGSLLTNLNVAVYQAGQFLESIQDDFAPMMQGFSDLAVSAKQSLDTATEALASVEKSIDVDSSFVYEISQLLDALKDAARSIAEVASALERNPEAMLQGKNQKERY